MNSVDKWLPMQRYFWFHLASAMMLTTVLSLPAQAQAPQVMPPELLAAQAGVAPAEEAQLPVAASDTLAETPADAQSESKMDSEVAEQNSAAGSGDNAETDTLSSVSTEDVLKMLQNGNAGEPLNVRQLAAINNLIRRMDYIAQIEKKMGEMSLGGVAPHAASPAASSSVMANPTMGVSPLASSADAHSYSVLRVSGSAGVFTAVLGNGSTQLQVRQGDMTSIGRIAAVTLSGVTVMTETGAVTLGFAAPAMLSGVMATIPGR